MSITNETSISDFLLLGFSQHTKHQPLLFGLFLAMYLVTILGNLLIILAISSDTHLHTPMYFLLANLSFTDTCFSCTIVPKVLLNIHTQHYTISHTGCLVQMFFFMELTLLDDFLLAVMAYDRYVAICLPLHYTTIMGPQRCLLLVTASWLSSYLLAFSLCLLMSHFSFCASHAIPHFFCDLLPLLKLACSDTRIFQLTMLTEAAPSGLIPLTCVLVSYAHIIHTILRIPSPGGKHKVFSTCGSHLTVVTLFYGTLFLVYFQPSSSYSADTGMAASVVYTMVTPMLNPFIYSLRNRHMKGALLQLVAVQKEGLCVSSHNFLGRQLGSKPNLRREMVTDGGWSALPVLGFITSLKAQAESTVENGSQSTLPPAPSVTITQHLCKNSAQFTLVRRNSLAPGITLSHYTNQ
nr:olfactory receptor 1G1-like [Odocoileus virginianus texanus]